MIVLCLALALQQPSDSLTLSEALERARRQRGTVASSAAGVAGARATVRTAGAIPNPTISYSHTEATPVNHFLVDQPLDWLLRRGTRSSRGPSRRRAGGGRLGGCSHVAAARGADRVLPRPGRAPGGVAGGGAGHAGRLGSRHRVGPAPGGRHLAARAGTGGSGGAARAPEPSRRPARLPVPRRRTWPARSAGTGRRPSPAARSTRASTGSPTTRSRRYELPAVRAAVADSAAAAARGAERRARAHPASDAPVRRGMGRRRAAGRAGRDRTRGPVPALEPGRRARRTRRRPAPCRRRPSLGRPGSRPCGSPGRPASIWRRPPRGRAFDRDSLVPAAAAAPRAGASGRIRPARPASFPCSMRCAASATCRSPPCRTSSPTRRRSRSGTPSPDDPNDESA